MKARVTAEVGDLPVVFDFQEFLNLSDAKRREFVYGLSPIQSDNWDKATVLKRMEENLLTLGCKVNDPDLYAVTIDMIKECLNEWPDGYDLTAGLQSMLTWASDQQRMWNDKKSDATGAVRELSEMKSQLEETDRDIVSKKEELKELRVNLTDIHGKITAGKEIERQWEQKKIRKAELNDSIIQQTVLMNAEPLRDYEQEVVKLNAQIKTTDIAAGSAQIQNTINDLKIQRDGKTTELDTEKLRLIKLEGELDQVSRVSKNIADKGAGTCVLHASIACEKDFTGFLNHATHNIPKLEIDIAKLKEQINVTQADIKTMLDKETELDRELRSLYVAVSVEAQENTVIRSKIDKVRESEREELQVKRDAQGKIVALQDELDKLTNEKQPMYTQMNVLENQHAALTVNISGQEAVIGEKEKAKVTLSNSQTAMINARKSQHKWTAAKNISKELGSKGIQGELVKSIIGPIEGAINENLNLMGIHYPVFFSTESETGKEVFQFGWTKYGRKTNFDVLSTGEQLMFMSAFLVTLLERKDLPLKVLALDNIENLDKVNLIGALNGLNALSHKLDNILIAGVIDIKELDGWKVWDLTPMVAVEDVGF
ncbi:MAG: hypothetical protein K6T85_05105 [Gorillibacterium sp.]|nr:hypothetical protein [Gorillibacterium sp.]